MAEKTGGKAHLSGANARDNRMYQHIKESTRRSGCYRGRAGEVAARTVMTRRRTQGHGKGE